MLQLQTGLLSNLEQRNKKLMISTKRSETVTEFACELIDFPEGKLEWIPDEKLTSLNLWESDHIFFAKFEYKGM